MFNQKKLHRKRIFGIIAILLLAFFGVGLMLYSFNNNLVFFYSPSEITQNELNKTIRLGGMVKEGSLMTNDLRFHKFVVTDFKDEMLVKYDGILPNLFKEGQGVVAKGRVIDGIFMADELLAKHDENYMPKEVYDTLRQH